MPTVPTHDGMSTINNNLKIITDFRKFQGANRRDHDLYC